jgi:hypothetical protein
MARIMRAIAKRFPAVRVAAVASLLLVAPIAAPAGQVALAWDPVAEADGYCLYAWTNVASSSTSAAVVRVGTGARTSAVVEGLAVSRWFFGVTACRLGAESDLSDVVPTEVLPAPGGFRTVILEHVVVLTNAWQDVGFFRVRFE